MITSSVGGIFSELNFLTNIPVLFNYDNKDTIYNELFGEIDIKDGVVQMPDGAKKPSKNVVFKGSKISGTEAIKNYYMDNVYNDKDDLNTYLGLLKKFEADGFESMRFSAADFAYLKELGVYPINRMWTLRRFPESALVPDNLQDWGEMTKKMKESAKIFPISTVVGWIKPEANASFFNIDFHEDWTIVEKRLDETLMDMLGKEFGFKGNAIPKPGWSQGLLFEFLKSMGVSDYGLNNIPMGDPNVLQEGASRSKEGSDPSFGLKSNMTITLNTIYEQKYIGDVDPGSAMLDIIQNLTKMGTSDVKYILSSANDDSGIIKTFRQAIGDGGNSKDAWWSFITATIDAFVNAINALFTSITNLAKDLTTGIASGVANGDFTTAGNTIKNTKDTIIGSILTSTVAKWRWTLRGSLALMTGENSTPWHLTIGNPYSPFVSMGNVVVKSVKLDFNNELGFNDIPTTLKVTIEVALGRNLGAQEIFQMFNRGYERVYSDTGESISNNAIANNTTTDQQQQGILGVELGEKNPTKSTGGGVGGFGASVGINPINKNTGRKTT